MTFNVNYNAVTGEIASYQEGDDPAQNDCPEGCATLSFKEVFKPMFDEHGVVMMKVDVVTKQLMFLNPVVIPQPI
jgi:hypothetical protein